MMIMRSSLSSGYQLLLCSFWREHLPSYSLIMILMFWRLLCLCVCVPIYIACGHVCFSCFRERPNHSFLIIIFYCFLYILNPLFNY